MHLRNYLENHHMLSENRLPARTLLLPAHRRGVTHQNPLASDRIVSLNGQWRFCYLPEGRLTEEYVAFMEPAYPDSQWDTIPVPSMWQYLGYGNCLYPNVEYPFPYDPPYIHTVNPIGLYRHRFQLDTLPEKLLIRFGGVDSAYFLYCNGQYVGFSKGSRIASEFDLTPYAAEGENVLAVQVHTYCDGSYLENQDMLLASGIFRDVTLLFCGADSLWDYTLLPEEDRFHLTCSLSLAHEDVILEAELYDTDGSMVASQILPAAETVSLHLPVPDARYWTAETPWLYELVLTLKRNGKILEVHTKKAGLCSSAIEGAYLTQNGKPIYLKGVNRHDNNPWCGKAITAEQIRRELTDIKNNNLNAIRCSHYTQQPVFYEIASELGLYVMDEADLETHGAHTSGDEGAISKMPDWLDAYMDRITRMYQLNKNETCINIWSLGNECGQGDNLDRCGQWLRNQPAAKPLRLSPINPDMPSDFRFTGYMPMSVLEGYAPEGKPVMMLEYAHAMGNSPGGLWDIWNFIYRHDYICGGYVWEYKSHGFSSPDEQGKERYLYGGDFGDKYHWSNFSLDGYHTSDGTPKPAWTELREVSAPVWIEQAEDGILVHNTYDFLSLAGVRMDWCVTEDSRICRSGTMVLEDIPARGTGKVCLPLETDGMTGTVLADFTFVSDTTVLSHKQLLLKDAEPETVQPAACVYDIQETDDELILTGEDVRILFRGGLLAGYTVQGKEKLTSPLTPNLWRAPTDNDGIQNFSPRHLGEWKGALLHTCRFGMYSIHTEQTTDAVTVKAVGKYLPQGKSWGFDMTLTYVITAGGKIRITMDAAPYGNPPSILPRIGMMMGLVPEISDACWFGRGPGESYSDACHSTVIGLYTQSVEDMHFRYDVPQETGNHQDCRFVRAYGAGGGICCSGQFAFSLHNFTLDNLTEARHCNELLYTPERYLYIDMVQRGLGSHSCGPEPEKQYELPTAAFTFTWTLSPDHGTDAAFRMSHME